MLAFIVPPREVAEERSQPWTTTPTAEGAACVFAKKCCEKYKKKGKKHCKNCPKRK